MNYIKITNIIDNNRIANYKGLDINKIVAGSQIYPMDNTAYFIYTGEIIEHEDVIVLTEEEYIAVRDREIPKSPFDLLQDQVGDLTIAMASMMGM